MTEVKDGKADDLSSIADALVSAFDDDPVMLHIFNKESGREKKMRALFASEMKRALKKGAVHTTAEGSAKGGAIWMAPGQWKLGGTELLGQIPLLFALGGAAPRALGLLSKMEKVHPTEPFFCYAPPAMGEFSITPSQPYFARYRFMVADGMADKALIERIATDYESPPTVKVN